MWTPSPTDSTLPSWVLLQYHVCYSHSIQQYNVKCQINWWRLWTGSVRARLTNEVHNDYSLELPIMDRLVLCCAYIKMLQVLGNSSLRPLTWTPLGDFSPEPLTLHPNKIYQIQHWWLGLASVHIKMWCSMILHWRGKPKVESKRSRSLVLVWVNAAISHIQ